MADFKTILTSLAIFFMLSMLLFAQTSCTQPPVATYVSNLPAIKPEGEFFNLRNAVLTNNASEVGVLFADEYFEDKQNLFLQKFELGTQFISEFSFMFQNYMFENKESEQNYKYDEKGNFVLGRGHTVFEGTLMKTVDDSVPVPASMLKIAKNSESTGSIPEKVHIYAIWVADNIGWKIMHMEINEINLEELLVK